MLDTEDLHMEELDWIGSNNMGGRAMPMADSYASEPELD